MTEDELKAIERKLQITVFPWDGEGRSLLPSDIAALIAEVRRLQGRTPDPEVGQETG